MRASGYDRATHEWLDADVMGTACLIVERMAGRIADPTR